MLIGLGVRDVVLIERLDLAFGPGLTALTGETGAGKSIILDALGLATGARADAGLVRRGADQASATAIFALGSRPRRLVDAGREGPRLHARRRPGPAPHAGRRRPLPRLRQRPAGQRRRCCASWARCCWKCTASTRPSACSMPPPTARCSTPSAACGARLAACAEAWSALARGARAGARRWHDAARPLRRGSRGADRCAWPSSTGSIPREGEETDAGRASARCWARPRRPSPTSPPRAEALRRRTLDQRLGQALRALERARERALAGRRQRRGPARQAGSAEAVAAVDRALLEPAEADAAIDAAGAGVRLRARPAGEGRGAAVRAARHRPQARRRRSTPCPRPAPRFAERLRADRDQRGGAGRRRRPRPPPPAPPIAAAAAALSAARRAAGDRLAAAVEAELAPAEARQGPLPRRGRAAGRGPRRAVRRRPRRSSRSPPSPARRSGPWAPSPRAASWPASRWR